MIASRLRSAVFFTGALYIGLSADASFADEPAIATVKPSIVTVDADSVVDYIWSCKKTNGAFGPRDQEYTDAAWNYPAVHTLVGLEETIPNKQAIIEHGLGQPPGHLGYGHWLFFHQQMTRKLLGVASSHGQQHQRLMFQGYQVNYYGSPFNAQDATVRPGYYNLSSLYYLVRGIEAAGGSVAEVDELAEFIGRRQAPGGGFVDLREAGRQPIDAEAHVAHTFHAVATLRLLKQPVPRAEQCAAWVRRCQLPSGGFGWNPQPDLPGNYADIYYTWAGLNVLQLVAQSADDKSACLTWINSLQNHDGGFADQPGWRSRLYSTFYAVDALGLLVKEPRRGITRKQRTVSATPRIPPGKYGIYQGLHKMPVCRPGDLPGLAARKFNLLALKSDKLADATPLIEAIQANGLPLDVVLCPEAYPHRARRHGGPLLHHIGNFTLDPNWTSNEWSNWQRADQLGRQELAWIEYKRQVIGPLRKLGSLVYPEHEFEMEFGYSAYDDGVHRHDSYNAILAGFNWPPRDFVRIFPWRERYVDKLVPVADADAHGDLAKWSPQLDHTRHLYLAEGPSYEEFLQAAESGRVVCVVHNAPGVASGVTYYGRTEAVDYVRQHLAEWKWW